MTKIDPTLDGEELVKQFESNKTRPIKSKRIPYFYDKKFENELSKYSWGDQYYDDQRKKAYDYLVGQGLGHEQANDVLDTFVTKLSHLHNKRNIPLLATKVGRFSTGNSWDDSQTKAREIFQRENSPFGVVYGFRNRRDPKTNFHKNDGLITPFVVDSDELTNIQKALKTNHEDNDFDLDVYYGHDL